jgi:hypothetical protein
LPSNRVRLRTRTHHRKSPYQARHDGEDEVSNEHSKSRENRSEDHIEDQSAAICLDRILNESGHRERCDQQEEANELQTVHGNLGRHFLSRKMAAFGANVLMAYDEGEGLAED